MNASGGLSIDYAPHRVRYRGSHPEKHASIYTLSSGIAARAGAGLLHTPTVVLMQSMINSTCGPIDVRPY